ncbi:hypothetical protein R3P38DRAFT_3069252, partial [Favolaschia claudopus]
LQNAQSRAKGGGVHVKARMYGGGEVIPWTVEGEDGVVVVGGKAELEREGWREASKIIGPQMKHVQVEGEWAALLSNAESDTVSLR